MVQHDALVDHVRDALAHLYDRPYLRAHPLGPMLCRDGQQLTGDELRRVLLDAVEEIRPPEPCPPDSPAWRPFRYLTLRYVEGAKAERIANELQVSIRQSQREHDRALEQVADLIRERYLVPSRREDVRPRSAAQDVASSAEGAAGSASRPEPPPGNESADLLRVGTLPPDEPTSLAEVLADAKSIVDDLARLRGAHVEVSLDPALPRVRLNRLVLRQVVIDLLSCAVEARARAAVRVVAASAEDAVTVSIVVPGEAAYSSTELVTRLSASHTLIGLQNGSLAADTPEGSAFTARLRLPRSRFITLLVVDDNPDVAYMFGRFLEDCESRVLHAATAPAALSLAREVHPDAVTLDVLMPSKDGWDVLREFRRDPETRDIPIILCSVLPERSLALSLGVSEFLNKPVTRQTLLTALRRCVPALGAGLP